MDMPGMPYSGLDIVLAKLKQTKEKVKELEKRVEKLESKENTSVEELAEEQRQANLLHIVRRLYKTAKDLNNDINAFSRYKSASAKMLDSLESIYDVENDELTI